MRKFTQFRCYVNVFSNRISYSQTLQILYEDISAIGIETSQLAELFYDDNAIDKHIQTLSLELRSGSKYQMSGDAGSSIGKGKNVHYINLKSQSYANEIFKNQIKNVRAFILEAKRKREVTE